MPIRLSNYPIAYYPTPKCACTSVKAALYQIEHGSPWTRGEEYGRNKHGVHSELKGRSTFKALAESDTAWRFCVIRDPVSRILSCYSDRVVFRRVLGRKRIGAEVCKALDITPNPDLNEFILNLEKYRVASRPIAHHSRPQYSSIGLDLDYYQRVYPIEELDALAVDLSGIRESTITLPHLQTHGPKYRVEELSREALVKIVDLFGGDYILLKRYYTPAT